MRGFCLPISTKHSLYNQVHLFLLCQASRAGGDSYSEEVSCFAILLVDEANRDEPVVTM
jgi:hypothetical protein